MRKGIWNSLFFVSYRQIYMVNLENGFIMQLETRNVLNHNCKNHRMVVSDSQAFVQRHQDGLQSLVDSL